MESSFIKFIKWGQIGDLKIGMSREEVRLKMGVPPSWDGKSPTWGRPNHTPEESDWWFYYGDAVRIKFDKLEENGIANNINVCIENINKSAEPFLDWPMGTETTVGQLKEYVTKANLSWSELPGEVEGMWYVVMNEYGYVLVGSSQHGKIPLHNRKFSCIGFVSDRKYLPSEQKHPIEYNIGMPVVGRTDIMRSPYDPKKRTIDISDKSYGDKVKCPYTGQILIVPKGCGKNRPVQK